VRHKRVQDAHEPRYVWVERRPLVGHAGGGALGTEEISVEVGQVVVVALDALGKIPVPEMATAPGADARLRADDRGGQDVVASGSPYLLIGAVAGLFAGGVGDVVGVLSVQTRDGVAAAAVGEGDLLEALFGEHEGP
jgi:hypothetical protein